MTNVIVLVATSSIGQAIAQRVGACWLRQTSSTPMLSSGIGFFRVHGTEIYWRSLACPNTRTRPKECSA
jgi:hypothetical protein